MKILHVVPSLARCGGGLSEYVPQAAVAQLEAGAEEVAIAFYGGKEVALAASAAERAGVRFLRFRGARKAWNPIAFSLDFFLRFERVAQDYDLVHIHAAWMFPVWWAAHVARRLGRPYVMMPHGSFSPVRLRESGWKKRLVGWLDRHAARRAAALWATAESEAEEIRSFVPGVRVDVFPIGLDFAAAREERAKDEGKGGQRSLLFLSRISPIKGLDMLAEAWSQVQKEADRLCPSPPRTSTSRRWKLLIVGPDDRGYRAEIEKVFAEKCAAGSFEFRSPAFGDEKRALLSSADAFVLPTHNENWGIAVDEAMASGLPVVCTKGAPWRCLETANAGWWCETSVEGLERALHELMACSDDERRAMGQRARAWVEANLNWKNIGRKMRISYERELPVLMTASVDTRGMKGADFSAQERERMYLDTIRHYLSDQALGHRRKFIFAENSGWDLESMGSKLGPMADDRVEFVALDPLEFDISRGKGWNEFRLISRTVERSEVIRTAGAFLKVTGRYPVFNLAHCLREAETALWGRGCVFYGDIKDHRLYEWLHLPWPGHIGTSVLFASTVDAWTQGVVPMCERLDDESGYWAEHLIYDFLTLCRKKGKSVVCRFGRELVCGGMKGSKGGSAGYSKSNASLKERVNRGLGNLIRILFPDFWF